ncbi:hypothetical protein E1258_12150 [Micromonospora sp. KC207]|uniref:hypothetical protein n=1 Tax=Micromonospora sp. KC207 TaxID=2530377 RepID=UPI001049FC54|nr:hypothetical protein [Micromonospora sp. KC207]TDC61232.1 hypothetical protein E1258_12150 [Micromonospora sp. KC207]
MNVPTRLRHNGQSIRTVLLQMTLAVAMIFAATAVAAPAQAAKDAKTAPTAGTEAAVGAAAAPAAAPAGAKVLGSDSVIGPAASYSYNVYYYAPNYVEAYYTVYSGSVSFGVHCAGWGWVNGPYVGVGSWFSWVDCGSYGPATAFRFQTIG